jgi:hypothetical protein
MLYPGVRSLNPIALGAAVSQVVLPPWEDCAGAQYVAAYVDFFRTSGNSPLDVWLQTTLNAGQVRHRQGLDLDMDGIARRPGERITYQSRGRTWIAISGYRDGDIFYRKSNLACGGRRWHHIEFRYPISEKRRMDATVTRIAREMARYGDDCFGQL